MVSGDRATLTNNRAKSGKAVGYVLSGNDGSYNTNTAESNQLDGFQISGNNGLFEGNKAKNQKKGGFIITGANNVFDTNKAGSNGGSKFPEWNIAAGNIDHGNNSANGKAFVFGAGACVVEKGELAQCN